LLGIYLNDHLAGSTSGVELARRIARRHRGSLVGAAFERLSAEIAEDRIALLQMMMALGIPARRYKVLAGWALEKVGRLKLNGRLLRTSPLSSVIEFESMRLGVQGKEAGWRVLRLVADQERRLDPDRLDRLQARARQQADEIEELRMRAAAEAFVAS
jgi:hypothetical protein